jgi:hypothetical protein
VCHLDPASAGQVVVCVELLLQFQSLVSCVRLASSAPQAVLANVESTCKKQNQELHQGPIDYDTDNNGVMG